MPSPIIMVAIALGISLLANAGLAKLYVNAKADTARVQQAYDSFVAQTKVLGEAAQKKANEQKAADEKRRKDADAENATSVAGRDATIAKLRRDRESTRRNIVPSSPAGSKCPEGQVCFDRPELERTLREHRQRIRVLVDEGSAVATDMNTALKWAQSLGAPPH